MPLRIYPIRPLRYGRGYYGGQQGSGFNAAEAFKGLPALGEAIAKGMAQKKLDAQANQLMTPPNQPVDKQGTLGDEPLVNQIVNPAFTGGVAGMKLQQEYIKNQLDNQKLAQEVRNSQIASSMAARRGGGGGGGGDGGAGNASRWQKYLGGGGQDGQTKGKAGKPAAYQPGSSTVDTPTDYYNFGHQRADIDNQHAKGTYDRLTGQYSNLGDPDPKTGVRTTPDATVDAQGNVIKPPSMSVDKNGNVTLAPKGNYPGAYIPADEVAANMARYDGTLVAQGKQPRFTDQYLKTQNPQSGLPNGDAANPYAPQNNGQLDAIAPGKSYVDPTDGKVYTKQQPQKPAAQPPAKATSQVDTGDQSQQVAGAQPLPSQQPLTLASGQPQTQPGLVAGDQGQGTDYTAGSSQLSPVVPQAPVDVAAATASNTPGSFFPGATQPTDAGLPPGVNLGDEIARTQLASQLQGVA